MFRNMKQLTAHDFVWLLIIGQNKLYDFDYIFQTREDEISFDDIRKVGEGWCGTAKATDSV